MGLFRCPVCGWRHFGRCPIADLLHTIVKSYTAIAVAAAAAQQRRDETPALEHKPPS